MRLSISHTTHYQFDRPVAHGLQRLRVTPACGYGQKVVDWRMDLTGAKFEAEYDDHYHNRTTLISVEPDATEIAVTCRGVVETADNSGIIGKHTGNMPIWVFQNHTPLTKPGAKMKSLVQNLNADRANNLDLLHALSDAVLAAMRYEIGYTHAETSAEEAATAGHGVCQDHAHVFVGCARMLGLPARYVSGYLMMNDRIDQEAGHAWAEVHVPDLGWVGFDVSNGISPDERYVRVATGCDYKQAAPVTGISFGAGESQLKVSLAVEQQVVQQ